MRFILNFRSLGVLIWFGSLQFHADISTLLFTCFEFCTLTISHYTHDRLKQRGVLPGLWYKKNLGVNTITKIDVGFARKILVQNRLGDVCRTMVDGRSTIPSAVGRPSVLGAEYTWSELTLSERVDIIITAQKQLSSRESEPHLTTCKPNLHISLGPGTPGYIPCYSHLLSLDRYIYLSIILAEFSSRCHFKPIYNHQNLANWNYDKTTIGVTFRSD